MPSDKVTQSSKQLVITSRSKTFSVPPPDTKTQKPNGKNGNVFPIQNCRRTDLWGLEVKQLNYMQDKI